MTSISIHIKEDTAKRIDDLAASIDRSRSWVVKDAIEQYLEHQAWMDKATEAAVADIDAGTAVMISHEDVVKDVEARRKARGK